MNFNPMDLILIKERFYTRDSQEHKIIGDFIEKLLDIQTSYKKKDVLDLFGDLYNDNDNYGERFWNKNQMIELAYQINKSNVLKEGK